MLLNIRQPGVGSIAHRAVLEWFKTQLKDGWAWFGAGDESVEDLGKGCFDSELTAGRTVRRI
jgi:hypothetical protein